MTDHKPSFSGKDDAPITPYQRSLDIKRAMRSIEYLVKLSDKDGKLPEGMDRSALEEAKKAIMEVQATDVAAAMMTQNVPGEVSLVAWNRARRALFALAPVVVMRLADKVDSGAAPGSERILVAIANGLGLLVPGAPIDEGARRKQITQKDLADLSDEELERMLDDQKKEKA